LKQVYQLSVRDNSVESTRVELLRP